MALEPFDCVIEELIASAPQIVAADDDRARR
jgi:hypothetical protein